MNFKKESKYTSIAIHAFAVIASSMLFYLILVNFQLIRGTFSNLLAIFAPITFGLVMAYLFNFFLILYEEKVLSRFELNHSKKRVIGMILTYLSVFILFGLFLQFILPQLLTSLTGIITEIPSLVKTVSDEFIALTNSISIDPYLQEIIIDKSNEFIAYVVNLSTSILPMIANYGIILMSRIWNIVLGLIISIYLLAEKERFAALIKKSVYALASTKVADKTFELVDLADNIFGKFLSGKILDSAIIAVLTFFVLIVFKMPYPLLVAFIIGITNIIPFFGPFIGAVPAFFIILFVSFNQAFIFLILIIIIQQIDGNFIGPKILGDSLGINAFWILFSLLISGKLFGFIGMIIGVPLFAFIYAIIKELLEARLKKKSLPIETKEYEK